MLRNNRGRIAISSHRARIAAPHIAMRRTGHGRSFARVAAYPRYRVATFHAGRHRLVVARFGRRVRLGHGRLARLQRHEQRVAAVSRDTAIRDYVGPSSAYAPVSTPAGGATVGGASFYSGGRTASGGVVGAATCAHRSLPFGTRVLVTNLANGAKTVLTVNDRGPFVRGRILDVSRSAAGVLGMLHSGTARIAMQVVGRAGSSLY